MDEAVWRFLRILLLALALWLAIEALEVRGPDLVAVPSGS